MVTTASQSSHTLYACNSPCQGTAKSHGCKPSHYPERAMGQEGQETNQRQRSTPDLTPSPGAHPCSEMANNRPLPPSPFKAKQAKNSSSVAFGVWKGPRCDNRVLHTTPHKSKTTVYRKSLWVPTPCLVLQVTIKCVNTASECEQEKQQVQSTDIWILFVCTD